MQTVMLDSSDVFSGIFRSRMMCAVSLTILLYDHLCTLSLEIDYIWRRRPLNLGSALFLINRYIPYVFVMLLLVENWLVISSPRICGQLDIANAAFVSIGIGAAEAILCLRTWALWKQSKIIAWVLWVLVIINIPIAGLCFHFMFTDSVFFETSPGQFTCYTHVRRRIWLTLTFVVILVFETIIASLTLVKAVEAQDSNSRWVVQVHYQGIVYYLYILLLTVINVIMTVYLNNVGTQAFSINQGVLHTVLASRVIFLARKPSELTFHDSMFD